MSAPSKPERMSKKLTWASYFVGHVSLLMVGVTLADDGLLEGLTVGFMLANGVVFIAQAISEQGRS